MHLKNVLLCLLSIELIANRQDENLPQLLAFIFLSSKFFKGIIHHVELSNYFFQNAKMDWIELVCFFCSFSGNDKNVKFTFQLATIKLIIRGTIDTISLPTNYRSSYSRLLWFRAFNKVVKYWFVKKNTLTACVSYMPWLLLNREIQFFVDLLLILWA